MSQGNVEIVQRYYEAVNRSDDGAVRELLSPDFVADASRRLVEPGIWRGRDEAIEAAAQVRDTWDTLVVDPERLVEVGDRVVAIVRNRAVGKTSGVTVESLTGQVWTVSDGHLTRFEYFGTPEEALEAAGLSE